MAARGRVAVGRRRVTCSRRAGVTLVIIVCYKGFASCCEVWEKVMHVRGRGMMSLFDAVLSAVSVTHRPGEGILEAGTLRKHDGICSCSQITLTRIRRIAGASRQCAVARHGS
ncbi:hypothetical protein V8C86DRAFT_404588 [Haematococcus lacustris]